MNLIQSVITLMITTVFIVLGFFVAWYVVIPLILIGFLILGIRRLHFHLTGKPETHMQQLHVSSRPSASKQTVIDVEYTEL